MNLREAIEAGAQRVARRCVGLYLRRVSAEGGYEYEACALGAAYLGCHPDADLDTLSTTAIDNWVYHLNNRVGKQLGGYGFASSVYTRNDVRRDGEWDDLLVEYDHAEYGNARLSEVEVCDEPA